MRFAMPQPTGTAISHGLGRVCGGSHEMPEHQSRAAEVTRVDFRVRAGLC